MKHSFCEDWEFTRHWTEAFGKGLPVPKQQAVRLPHTCREVPLHYATPADYEMVCGYRKRFRVPPVQAAPRLFVRFDGAAHQAVVRVNGRVAGQHRGGYTGFAVEITDLVDREGENLLTVQLDTREDPTIPPFGFVIDYLTYGGLYRAVWLEADTAALAEAGILRGGDVMKHLENCPQAVLLAVTLGPGVDAQIRRAGVGDIAAGVASDALGSALAEQAADAAEAELRQWAAKEGKYLTGRFSPGYGDWDIAVQPLVANALDTVRRAGLCVTDTNLMTPRKSVTAILGVSGHPVKGKLAGCGHCVLRTRCEYRKRGKTCASE